MLAFVEHRWFCQTVRISWEIVGRIQGTRVPMGERLGNWLRLYSFVVVVVGGGLLFMPEPQRGPKPIAPAQPWPDWGIMFE